MANKTPLLRRVIRTQLRHHEKPFSWYYYDDAWLIHDPQITDNLNRLGTEIFQTNDGCYHLKTAPTRPPIAAALIKLEALAIRQIITCLVENHHIKSQIPVIFLADSGAHAGLAAAQSLSSNYCQGALASLNRARLPDGASDAIARAGAVIIADSVISSGSSVNSVLRSLIDEPALASSPLDIWVVANVMYGREVEESNDATFISADALRFAIDKPPGWRIHVAVNQLADRDRHLWYERDKHHDFIDRADLIAHTPHPLLAPEQQLLQKPDRRYAVSQLKF